MPQNNVRIPQCAHDALEKERAIRGLSRDETVRQLLTEYIDEQRELSGDDDSGDDRLTHVSTVMRHPLPAGRGRAKPGVSLRFRASRELIEEAKQLAYILPGQSRSRGHHDYQARPLTDAVMTAIARVQSFEDDVLRGIKPRIRQRAATGLWRLVAASTLSGSEWEILVAANAEDDERREAVKRGQRVGPVSPVVRVADELKEGDKSWHGRHRSLVAQELAQYLLSGPDADENEKILYDQDPRDVKWSDLRVDHAVHLREEGIVGFEGRGAGVVWRTRRQLQLDDLHKWLIDTEDPPTSGDAHALVMEPPGWKLLMPTAWRPLVLSATEPVSAGWGAHIDSGKVLKIAAGSKRLIWPTIRTPAGTGPVPGLEHVVAQAKSLRPEQIVEVLLRYIDDDEPGKAHVKTVDATTVRYPGDDNVKLDISRPLPVPAWTAYNLGIISADTRDKLVAAATALNHQHMADVIRAASNDPRYANLVPLLREAHKDGDITRFKKLADRAKKDFNIARPFHLMRGTTLAQQLGVGADPATISWLTRYLVRNTKRCLELSMEETSRHAFARFSALTQGKGGSAF